ncbi:LOW QUALITY PROTEIN: peptidase S8/S53 domain-containing protein [Copromyces sp. CBS 386.78]|nr:LOW QUALITY PROTEIN: peptidase S8/S53 domain-containing protein [Copromyces sp. CBS 386.78]
MFQALIWALLGLFSLFSSLATASRIVLEEAGHLPAGWKLDHHAERSRDRRQSKSGNDPNSRHLTKEEVDKHHRKSVAAPHGIKEYKAESSWITFDATAATVKALFGADLAYYSTQLLRARSYTIPRWLKDDIDFVHPLTHFMPPRNRNDTQPKLSLREDFFAPPCWTGTFPGCIRKLYNLTYTHPPRSRSPSSVRFIIAKPPYNITITLLNNATPWDPHSTDPFLSGLEANLDVQYALSLVIYYATGGRGTKLDSSGHPLPANDPRANNEPFFEFLQALLALPDKQIPHQSVPLCDLFAALAARGTSVLVATGDGGAAGIGYFAGGGDSCIKNDGSAFVPTFPASCPVGATDNTALDLTGAEFSSGGFSEPLWQRAAVDPYVSSHLRSQPSEPGKRGQSHAQKPVGRGTPDIAAIGSGFQIMHRGEMVEVRGTRASTPVVAAMVALRSLGWLNGYLYLDQRMWKLEGVRERRQGNLTQVGGADGTQGEGDADGDGEQWEEEVGDGDGDGEGIGEGGQSGNVIVGGWNAKKGWDPVTGLGVPGDFQDMLRVLGGVWYMRR